MSFDYDKIAAKEGEHSSWWTSYADLFMMLSIVFLLMYVTSSLRSGSVGFQQQMEYKKLTEKAEGLSQQIKVYNTLKDEALKKESDSEQEVYQKLMGKLSLLKDEARDEKIALRKKAKENEEKEFALNQYQEMVRNIINANILAKTQIHHRDELIVTKDATIEQKKQKIAEMEKIVAQNEQQISTIHAQLEEQITALRMEQASSKTSKVAMEAKIMAMRQESEAQVQEIEAKKRTVTQQLTEVKSTLEHTEAKLDEATGTIQKQDVTIQLQEQEKAMLTAKLSADRDRYASELRDLKTDHDAQLAAERNAFMANLKKQRLSADARAKKIAKFAAEAEKKAGDLEGQLSGLRGKIAETDAQLKGAQADYEATQARLAGTQKQLESTKSELDGTRGELEGTQEELANTQADKKRALAAVEDLQGDLARTRAIANARKTLAKQITDEFAKSGLKGKVDGKTGEVTLDFGGEYFETGSTALKPKMRMTLDKFIPIYARSLFSNPKLADKIGNVEIVGFASSTYKGQYVNPKSTREEDKAAIEYNLKLSFGRANSIFKHVLNHGKLTDAEREKLMPLMKIVGRGYLPDGVSASELPDGMTEKQFCAKFNCKQAQRVIVKFNMKD